MASKGPVLSQGKERLGIYAAERGTFESKRVSENETSLEVPASCQFLKSKSSAAKEQYQIIVEDVVAAWRSVVRILHGSVYPGPYTGGVFLPFWYCRNSRPSLFP